VNRKRRRARRDRIARRARQRAGLPTSIHSVQVGDVAMRLWDHPGKIAGYWRRGGLYETPLLKRIHRRRYRGTALDIGANIGNHTLWLAVVCGLRVVAFEPVEHAELSANVALNDLGRRVRVVPVALGDARGTATHVAAGRLAPGGDLSVRTLDSYRLRGVTLMKIDVEGMEPAVLRGGEQTIRRDRPTIWAEEHNQTEHDAIADVLLPWGYRMTRWLHGRGQATPMGQWVHPAV
jgi:FkbM family methyltransferase